MFDSNVSTGHNTRYVIQNLLGIVVPDRDLSSLECHVKMRMKHLGFVHERQYCEHIKPNRARKRSNSEWDLLIQHITNGESYFFRDPDQLQLISQTLLPELIDQRRKMRRDGLINDLYLNLWSAGCSTGEEPYSLAMMLRELLPDIESWQINLIATDINPHAIASARQGRYRGWSFRQMDARYKFQYFQSLNGTWQVKPELKSMIQWDVLNLVDSDAIARRIPWASMDLILCRNVFIYFENAAISQTIESFVSALNHDGYLIVGHAELEGQTLRQFKVCHHEGSMFYQKSP